MKKTITSTNRTHLLDKIANYKNLDYVTYHFKWKMLQINYKGNENTKRMSGHVQVAESRIHKNTYVNKHIVDYSRSVFKVREVSDWSPQDCLSTYKVVVWCPFWSFWPICFGALINGWINKYIHNSHPDDRLSLRWIIFMKIPDLIFLTLLKMAFSSMMKMHVP